MTLAAAAAEPWRELAAGLWLGVFDAPKKSFVGDSKLTVLKVDPKQHTLKLLCAAENKGKALTAKEWCRQQGLVAAINAGMYQSDLTTSAAYMKNEGHILNSKQTKDKCFIAFAPTDKTLPPFQIMDTEFQDFAKLAPKYATLIQDIRCISLKGKNVWAPQQKFWSMAIMATDKEGNALWIFCRSPYSVHDLANMLLTLPLKLRNAAYLDGGPPASLYVHAGGTELELFGSFETEVNESNDNDRAWVLPNVIGLVKTKD